MPQAFSLVMLALWITALVDVIRSDEYRIRYLPKFGWIMIVILVPLVGGLLWFILGKPWDDQPRRPTGPPPAFPEYDRPNRHIAQAAEDDEEFLRRCRERAEEQRKRHRDQQREREQRDHDEPR